MTGTETVYRWETDMAGADYDDNWSQGWLEEAGKGITVSWLQKMTDQSMTSVCCLKGKF